MSCVPVPFIASAALSCVCSVCVCVCVCVSYAVSRMYVVCIWHGSLGEGGGRCVIPDCYPCFVLVSAGYCGACEPRYNQYGVHLKHLFFERAQVCTSLETDVKTCLRWVCRYQHCWLMGWGILFRKYQHKTVTEVSYKSRATCWLSHRELLKLGKGGEELSVVTDSG